MPELPEVDVMAERMDRVLRGRTVKTVRIYRNPGGRYDGAQAFLDGAVVRVGRRGKVMIFELDHRGVLSTVTAHNAMSGFWDTKQKPWTFDYVEGARVSSDADVRVELLLDDSSEVRFHDARLFGRIRSNDYPRALGPDIFLTEHLSSEKNDVNRVISYHDFKTGLKGEKTIKERLMDQHFVAGLGNIYVTEILWWSHVRPDRTCSSLTEAEKTLIFETSQKIMRMATTFKGPDGQRSIDYSNLFIYRRDHCSACGSKTEKIEIAKRSTYFCSQCQS